MKKLFFAAGILFLSFQCHAEVSGVLGDYGYQKLWFSSYAYTAQLGILSSGCVVLGGFRVAESTGDATVKIGFYAANSTGLALPVASALIATYSLTSENHGFFNFQSSTGAVYNVVRPNTGVTVPPYVIYWDYLSPSCMPRQLR